MTSVSNPSRISTAFSEKWLANHRPNSAARERHRHLREDSVAAVVGRGSSVLR